MRNLYVRYGVQGDAQYVLGVLESLSDELAITLLKRNERPFDRGECLKLTFSGGESSG
jgi:hypothetical protein